MGSGGFDPSLGTEPTEIVDASELVPGMNVGEYRIEGKLGAGGMGRVYAAVHPVIAKRAAIKVLHPELSVNQDAIARFVQEARSVNQIGSPHIVDIFSFGVLPDGRHYFVMELLRGESVRERLMRQKRIPLGDALAIVETITLPLEAAHEQGIVHRDLKPDNVFLVHVKGDRPQVKLLDFGIAKLLGGTSGLQRTQTGHMLGTPAYCSPEQARAENVDHRTDIYALGALAFEILTGEIVFPATNAADMIASHLNQPPRSVVTLDPAIPLRVDALITRMLAKDPNARPTLEQARDELRACRGGLPTFTPSTYGSPPGMFVTPPPPVGNYAVTVPEVRVAPRAVAPSRRRAWVIAISLVVSLALGVVVIYALSNSSDNVALDEAKPPTVTQPSVPPSDAPTATFSPDAALLPDEPAKPTVTTKSTRDPRPGKTPKVPKRTPPRKGGGSAVTKPFDPDAPL